MRNFRKIEEELKNNAPDLSEKISNGVNWNEIAAKNGKEKSSGKGLFRFRLGLSLAAAAMAAAVIVPLSVYFSGRQPYVPAPVAVYDIVIDVNPNISFSVGENDIVTAQKGLNEDGVVFLYNRNYIGEKASEATRAVIGDMKNKGVISSGSVVRLSVFDHKTREINDEAQSEIEKSLEGILGADVTTLFLSDEELDKIEDYYENHTVKENDKKLIENFKNKVLKIASEKLSDIRTLLEVFGKYDGEEIVLSDEDKKILFAFIEKYSAKPDFDPNGTVSRDDLEDFTEDLEEISEDIREAIEEIGEKEKEGDVSELVEELVDLVKDCLWK